ncbi:MAG: hypothetical protein QNJ73_01305 [Gammaproteobacteria bacterium]|nr:hypothetical protein [Gammaproteobacteria bacterium]
MNELENATYQGISAAPVTLSNGRWEGQPYVAGGAARPAISLASGFRVTGDVTGNGIDDAIERRFQTALRQVRRYSFRAGRLTLHWRGDHDHGTMLFAARDLAD